jgi:alanine dehydrogenase
MYVIGIPKEIKANERRISMIPEDVRQLIEKGFEVFLETMAGDGAGYSDDDYINVGAKICDTHVGVFDKANVIVKVKEPLPEEYDLITNKHIVYSFFHFASSPSLLKAMIKSGASCIAYETIQDDNKAYPILAPMSKIAGEQAMKKAHEFLNNGDLDSEGINVTIIGVGNVGKAATLKAKELGYKNINIIDKDYEKLKNIKYCDAGFMIHEMTEENLSRLLKFSNIVIGSIYNTGEKANRLISNDMLNTMPDKCIIMDVAIDQGGITEQSKPTTMTDPIITYNNRHIYCVPNIPSCVPSEASQSLSNAIYPYLCMLLESENIHCESLSSGLNIYNGTICHSSLKSI